VLPDQPPDIHTMVGHGFVLGIAVVGSELFVVRDRPSVGVDAYESTSFTLKRNVAIPNSKRLWAITACTRHKCLYISDFELKMIYRCSLSNNMTSNNWSVSLTGTCTGLSVTRSYNLLASLWDTKRIQEYTMDGCLIREISLDNTIDRPQHCIELPGGGFVVSHGDITTQRHRVCYVDERGNVIQSYGGDKGSEVGQLNAPCHMAVTSNNHVLVADCFNSRVELLSPTLSHIGYIPIPALNLYGPYTVNLDEINRRLYVGEWAGGRVFSINMNMFEEKMQI